MILNVRWCLRIALSLLLLCFAYAEDLEVSLQTQGERSFVYLTRLHLSGDEPDWRYFDELREVLEFDLQANGFMQTAPVRTEWEETLTWPDIRFHFDMAAWKNRNIPYVVAIQAIDHRLQVVVFNVEQGTAKKYADLAVTGNLPVDRSTIHKLSDTIQLDLFGIPGIASLKILYSKRYKMNDEWHSDIWISDSDGANARAVIAGQGYCVSPAFFPGSDNRFYYVCFQDGQSKIHTASLDHPKGSSLLTLRGNQVLPASNAQGDMIAFISDVAGRPDLFIQKLNAHGTPLGKPRQIFSAPRSTQASPTFSPDGKQIAFVSDKDGPPRIYAMNVATAKETKKPAPRLLTKKNRENTSPAWSPDGTKIAYSAKVDGVRQIWICDVKTEEERAVTNTPGNKENPSWAPDSLHLVYNSEDEDVCELYRVNIKQGVPALIHAGSEQKRFPSLVKNSPIR